ncbi:MAG TPA: DegT/DnrJ/EryC1/StrS family aminotransferase [Rectinemataceae bacterium]|nr:DegT/DnrJ/EryC1/StrS family aminotransferase [Rectinemataceae bacterium]
MSIPVFRSYIKRKDMDTVLSCLMTDSVGPGSYLERFQKNAREYFGIEFGFLVRSPLDGLAMALDALAVKAGDAVVISALAPRWYAAGLSARGISVLFADVQPDSANPSASDFAKATEADRPRVKALVLAGGCGIMPEAGSLEELGLPVIEDITRSLGATKAFIPASTSATIGILGLEHGSLLISGGGAMVFAEGKREAAVLKNQAEAMMPESRMTDYNASLGLAQLRDLEKAIEKRRELRTLFLQALAGKKQHSFIQAGDLEAGCWSFPVVLESSVKDVVSYARKKDVETELAFADSCISNGLVPEGACPNARSLSMRTLLFPLHQRIGNAGAQKISRVLATLP